MENVLEMNSNLLVEFLQKPSSQCTKADIISFIREKGIKMVNLIWMRSSPAASGWTVRACSLSLKRVAATCM